VRSRGVTLLELLLVLALLGIVLGLAFVQLRAPARSQQSRALAEVILARFAQARQRAIASGQPVALAFPRNATQTSYLLTGEYQPQRVLALNWSRELPHALVSTHEWTLDGDVWSAGPASLDLSAWQPPQPADALFAFQPSGALTSNLRLFGGAYRIVTCTGLASGGPGLTAVSHPWTLSASPTGLVQLSVGLENGSAVLQPGPEPGPTVASAIPPVPTDADPVLVSVQVMPPPAPASLPPGVDASVRPGGYLTFEVRATDPDRDTLRCWWSTSRGTFSATQEVRMEWDPQVRQWVSRWTFTPPTDAAPGDIFTLDCVVKDVRGNRVTGTFPVGGRVLITRRPRLCFASNMGTQVAARRGLYVSNIDGTERKLIFDARGTVDCPRWSPDGSLLIFLYDPTGGIDLDLWAVRPDGTDLRRLIDASAQGWLLVSGAAFTPDGTKIVVQGYTNTVHDLVWTNVDGTRPSAPSVPGYDVIRANVPGQASFTGLDIHPGTGHVLSAYRDGSLHLFRTDGTELPVAQPPLLGGIQETQVCFTPDGAGLYINHGYTSLYRADFAVSGAGASVTNNLYQFGDAANAVQGPHVSPDGQYLFYNRTTGAGAPLELVKRDLTTGTEFLLTPPGIFDDDVWCSP
jgi:prepilin-type N-terminal cleavage/methylation domain-containing protein